MFGNLPPRILSYIMIFRRSYIILALILIFSDQSYISAQVTDSTQTVIEDSLKKLTDSLSLEDNVFPQHNSYEIKGIIKNKATGEPVPFATIFFPNSSIGTPADLDGNFTLSYDTPPGDTIMVEALGFKGTKLFLNKTQNKQDLVIELKPGATLLKEVVIRPGEDPAIQLLKKIIRRKPYNDPARFATYSYESYNKLELDILRLSKEEFEKLPVPYIRKFSFIYDNLDTSGKEPFLPFYLTETIADYYYEANPKKTKEYIKASQVKGINNQNITKSMTTYLGNTYLVVNPYDNYVQFFNKQYVSPLNNAGPTFYKYKIRDTEDINGYKVFTLSFKPLREGENCFEGTIKIVDSIFALQYIAADVPKEANINWVKNASFYKEYSPVSDSVWFCTKENMTAEVLNTGDLVQLPAFIARRTNSYRNIKVNDTLVPRIVNSRLFKRDVVVADTAMQPDENFWIQNRHDTLNKNETAIYGMFDTLEKNPTYMKFKRLMRFLLMGTIRTGPIEFGPYWTVYDNTQIEGTRLQFTVGTTPKFSKSVYMYGYVARGFKDEKFKFKYEGLWLIRKPFPRQYIDFNYTHNLDKTVNYYDRVTFDNVLNVAIRKKGVPSKFVFADDIRFEHYKEYWSGFSHLFTLLRKTYDPYAPLPDTAIYTDVNGLPTHVLTQSEVNVRLRYAYKERFLESNYYRVSLGSKYPIAEVRLSLGIKGFLKGGYNYKKIRVNVSDVVKIAPLGNLYFNVFAGKYFGTLPYNLLELHPGNENYYYSKYAFNMMNLYEFVSDQYAGFNIEHSIGGGIFHLIPLVKKLKFRQFWTAKGVIGSLSPANEALNLNKGFPFKTLANNPYIEVGTGVENILKLLRVDFVWRVTPKALPTEPRQKYFGIFGSVKLDF